MDRGSIGVEVRIDEDEDMNDIIQREYFLLFLIVVVDNTWSCDEKVFFKFYIIIKIIIIKILQLILKLFQNLGGSYYLTIICSMKYISSSISYNLLFSLIL